MKLKMTTLSSVVCASGESTTQFDVDVRYCRFGFPYIPGKTFKGVLRESALEVCDIIGIDYKIIDTLFGVPENKDSGDLKFNNIKIFGYDDFYQELEKSNLLDPNFVKEHYTTVLHQTTIEEGITKKGSLRKYRVIKEDVVFETEIETNDLTDESIDFLKKALLHLRYIGLRRNRGFGKVKFEINPESTTETVNNAKIENESTLKTRKNLSFEIKTLSPLIISKILGEQNTVYTEQFIPTGNQRGLISGLIIENEDLSNDTACLNDIFKKLILNGAVKFNNAFLKGTMPVPKIYGYDKTENESKAQFIIDAKEPLKACDGFVKIKIKDEEIIKYNISTIFNFHTSRFKNRIAGKSTEEDGSIFYYEGIDEHQVFECNIMGREGDLNYIQSLLKKNNGIHRMGKSRSAQYSKVKFNNFSISECEKMTYEDNKIIYIVFQSPVITYNEFGIAVPNMEIIKKELSLYFENISNFQSISSTEWVENYMGVWQSKTTRENSFAIGTTISFNYNKTKDEINNLEFNGLGERKNEGYGRIKIFTELPESLVRINEKDHDKKNSNSPFYANDNSKVILQDLYNLQLKSEEYSKYQKQAIEKAKNYVNKLSNSLIYKLKDELFAATDLSKWQCFLDKIKDKKAGKEIENIHLWDTLYYLKDIVESGKDKKKDNKDTMIENIDDFNKQKEFYLTFFKTLRIKSKKQQNNEN
jgi:CRISPR-associated protein Csx10